MYFVHYEIRLRTIPTIEYIIYYFPSYYFQNTNDQYRTIIEQCIIRIVLLKILMKQLLSTCSQLTMLYKHPFGALLIGLGVLLPTLASSQNTPIDKELSTIKSYLRSYDLEMALRLSDSLLLTPSLTPQQKSSIQALKVKSLVSAELYTDALELSQEVLKTPEALPEFKIRTRIERALLYEILGNESQSQIELDSIAQFYRTNATDQNYGEYLYRQASLYRVTGQDMLAQKFATSSEEFSRLNNHTEVNAVAHMVLGLLSPKDSISQQIYHIEKALNDFRNHGDLHGMAGMYASIVSLHLTPGAFDSAAVYLDSLTTAATKRNDAYFLGVSYELQSTLADLRNNPKEALELYKKATTFYNSARLEKQQIAVSEQDFKFELERRKIARDLSDEELSISKGNNKNLTILLVLLSIGLISVLLLWYKLKSRNEVVLLQKEEIESSNYLLEQMVDDKELLLKELNHRVKNNLSLILSLVQFHESETKETFHKERFTILENRIKAIALAHEQFVYDADHIDGTNYELKPYLEKISSSAIGLTHKKIKFILEIAHTTVSIDTGLPIGILVNELIHNSLKHAVPEGDMLTISCTITTDGHTIMIYYEDSGKEFKISENDKSLGLMIISGMVDQLNGTLKRKDSHYAITLERK